MTSPSLPRNKLPKDEDIVDHDDKLDRFVRKLIKERFTRDENNYYNGRASNTVRACCESTQPVLALCGAITLPFSTLRHSCPRPARPRPARKRVRRPAALETLPV